MKRIVFIFLALLTTTSWAATYYIRNLEHITAVERDGKNLIVYRTIDPIVKEAYGEPVYPTYYKDIYVARNDSVVLLKTVQGKRIPPQPERIEWPK